MLVDVNSDVKKKMQNIPRDESWMQYVLRYIVKKRQVLSIAASPCRVIFRQEQLMRQAFLASHDKAFISLCYNKRRVAKMRRLV